MNNPQLSRKEEMIGMLFANMGLREIKYKMLLATLCGFGIGLACGALLMYFL